MASPSVQRKKTSLPRYDERRGWVGGDSRTLYAFVDRRTGRVGVNPGGGAGKQLLMNWGPEAVVRVATHAEAESLYQSPLHAGWKVTEAGSQHATRKYGTKATEKVGQALHEFKHGSLRSGSGAKVTSRAQAIAIGLSQARSRGYKVPPSPSRHATLNLDARVRAHLSGMHPGQEIDARGVARALGGGIDPLEADYALERAAKAGLAVTEDGRWFGPAGHSGSQHAPKKSSAQIKREIDEVLAKRPGEPATTNAARFADLVALRLDRGEAVTLPYAPTQEAVVELLRRGYRLIRSGLQGSPGLPFTTLKR